MQSLLGYSLPTPVVWAVAFAIIFTLLAIFALVLRKLAGARLNLQGGAARGRQPRLGVVDAFSLDRQRQLVIVRRDNVEHLVLLGGPNDLLIESQILRGAPGFVQREPDLRAEPPRPELQRTDTPPVQAPPQPRVEMPPPPQPRVEMPPPPPPRPAPVIVPADSPKPDAPKPDSPKPDARSLAPRYEPPRPPVPPAVPPAAPSAAPAAAPSADRYRAPPAPPFVEPVRPAVSMAPSPSASPAPGPAADGVVREKPAPEKSVAVRTAAEIPTPPAAPLHAVRQAAPAGSSEMAKRLDEAIKRPVTDAPDLRGEANRPASPPPVRPAGPNFVPPPVVRPAMATLGEVMTSSETKPQAQTPGEPAKPMAAPAEPAKPEPTIIRPEPDLASVFAQEQRPKEPQPTVKRPEPAPPTPVKAAPEAMDFDSLEAEMSRLLGRDPSARKD